MEFKSEKCTFSIPDRPSVRQQLAWFGAVQGNEKEGRLLRWWDGAKELVTTWQCEIMPDYKVDLDTITEPSQAQVVIWAGLQVLEYMNRLDDIPKN